jgi:dTDP-4-dehydrorhamnose 3,5-epimerase
MQIEETALSGCFIVVFSLQRDLRGGFMRSFDREVFSRFGLKTTIDHLAEAFNPKRHTLRGMHFQASPLPDAKLVRCTKGSAFDVAVDLRPASPTRGQWHGVRLTENDNKALYIPEGFAHGYLTLSDNTTLTYQMFAPYRAELQKGFRYNDPIIRIDWPAPPALVGERDQDLPAFSQLWPQYLVGT